MLIRTPPVLASALFFAGITVDFVDLSFGSLLVLPGLFIGAIDVQAEREGRLSWTSAPDRVIGPAFAKLLTFVFLGGAFAMIGIRVAEDLANGRYWVWLLGAVVLSAIWIAKFMRKGPRHAG